MDNVKSSPGGSVKISVKLTNEAEIVSGTFSITLPEGVVPATNPNGTIQIKTTSRVPAGMTLQGSVGANGECRFAIMPGSNSIESGDGAIFSITLLPDASMELGNYDITLDDIKLVTTDLLRVQPFNTTATLTLKEPESGDVNGDGETDILDATYIVYRYLGRPTNVFYEDAGDVNGDGETDILDATIIVYRYLGRSVGANASVRKNFELDPQ
jgi:hypothetical protein